MDMNFLGDTIQPTTLLKDSSKGNRAFFKFMPIEMSLTLVF